LFKKNFKKKVVDIVIILLLATVLVFSWIFRNWLVYGDATISFQRGVVWQGLNPNFGTQQGCEMWYKLLEEEIKGMKFKD